MVPAVPCCATNNSGGISAAGQLRQTGFERCNKAHNYQEETSGESPIPSRTFAEIFDGLEKVHMEMISDKHEMEESRNGPRQTGEFDNQPKTHQGKLAEENRDNLQKINDHLDEIKRTMQRHARYMKKMAEAIRTPLENLVGHRGDAKREEREIANKHDQIETGMMDHHAENVGQTTDDACECDRKRNIALMTMETHFGDRNDSEIVEAGVFNKQDEIEHIMMGQHEEEGNGGGGYCANGRPAEARK